MNYLFIYLLFILFTSIYLFNLIYLPVFNTVVITVIVFWYFLLIYLLFTLPIYFTILYTLFNNFYKS